MGRFEGGFDVKRFLIPFVLLAVAACSDSPTQPQSLVSEDLVVGTGATAQSGDTITVNYIGRFVDGTPFDSSYARNKPYTFLLGAGQVIAGWDQGIPGMKVGGQRRLTIPPSLAYGKDGYLAIPPNSTLIFDIELLSIAGK
jgi:FKBP-type peptidyl-prolyl cis-trans isomerase